MQNRVIIVCGPTGSGKTAFAHALAQKHSAEIVNADAMQIYQQIPIITSSPSLALKNQLPYHLYNFLEICEDFSAIKYAELAAVKIKQIIANNKLPIIVGGSGLYIKSLISGYSQIPDISAEIKVYTQDLYNKIGLAGIWQELISADQLAAQRLNPADTQRILRAYEVVKQTGESIFSFIHSNKYIPLPDYDFKILFLLPSRSCLYDNCNQRVRMLLENGAIEEVQAIKDRLEQSRSSAAKALGIPEIISYLNNRITYQELIDLISVNTRHYAKRQITWFKHQIQNKKIVEYENQGEFEALLFEVKDFACIHHLTGHPEFISGSKKQGI